MKISKRWILPLAAGMSCTISTVVSAQDVRTFTDSRGKVFTTPDDGTKPKIVINGNGALSLYHMGMEADQLVATFDHWGIRGTDIDFSNLEDPDNTYESSFAIDPNQEEIEFLKSAIHLSPPCLANSDLGCFQRFEPNDLIGLDYDFFINQRAYAGVLNLPEGKEVLWFDDKWEHDDGCYSGDNFTLDESKCHATSLIDTVKRLEELADFLGIERTAKVDEEQQAMCESAANFVAHTAMLHEQGIYTVAASLRPGNGGTISWFKASRFPWLRTLEELGMPLVYPPGEGLAIPSGDGERYFGPNWFESDGSPKYDIDFWLFDSRSAGKSGLLSIYDAIAEQLPDPALQQGQYSTWVFNDGAISYTNIRRFLDMVREDSTGITRVHQNTIDCTEADVTSDVYLNKITGGAVPGQFACLGNLQALYTECPDLPNTPEPEPVAPTLCFSSENQVQLENGETKRMDQLELGDRVLTANGVYESIYSWGHYNPTKVDAEFVQLLPSRIELSSHHLLFLHKQKHPVPAGTIQVGDVLRSGETVTAVRSIKRRGVYAPFTKSGTIIVNGQMVSTYVSLQPKSDVLLLNHNGHWSTGISHHWLAHVFETPHRLWCQYIRCKNEESYTTDGISTWVSGPLEFFHWFLESHVFLQFFVSIPILSVFAIFALLEWLLLLFMADDNYHLFILLLSTTAITSYSIISVVMFMSCRFQIRNKSNKV